MKKKIVMLALVGAGIALAAKTLMAKKQEFEGLTEAEARAKLDARLPHKLPADKRAEITDKVVGKMRERDVLAPDPVASN